MPTEKPSECLPASLPSSLTRLNSPRLRLRRLPYWLTATLIMLLAMLISLAGLNAAPIEGHEIFVVQTAREMRAKGDWIVPWFNNELRLNKPPLNYWLTVGVSMIAGDVQVKTWHGRAVSTAGALLIVAMTLWTACLLGSTSLSITAGLLAATSVGYLMFTHDGRPDMLYAGLCTTMLPLWLYAWQAVKQKKFNCANLAIHLMWIALALATLSKGPHIPLIFLVIFIILTLWRDHSFKQCYQIFCPITGLALAVLLVAPWWLALYARIGDDLFQTQLAGKRYGMDVWSMANPFYLYRTLIVILPWCLLWFFAAVALFKKNTQGQAARLLFPMVAITLLALSMATGKRLVYVLPLLGPMSILLALGASQLIASMREHAYFNQRFAHWHTLGYTVITLLLIVITSSRHAHRLATQGLLWIPAAGVIGTLLTAWLVWQLGKTSPNSDQFRSFNHKSLITIRGAAVIFAWFMLVSSAAATTDGPRRWAYEESSTLVKQELPPAAPLYTMGVSMPPFVYFTGRTVHKLNTMKDLQNTIADSPDGVYMVVPAKAASRLKAAATQFQTVVTYDSPESNPFELLYFSPSPIYTLKSHPETTIKLKTNHEVVEIFN